MFSLLQNGYRSYLGDSNHFRLWKKIKNFVGCFCFCQCIALLAFKSCVGSSRGRRSQLLSILLLLAFIFTEWIIYELAVDLLCETSLCNHGSLLREFFLYDIIHFAKGKQNVKLPYRFCRFIIQMFYMVLVVTYVIDCFIIQCVSVLHALLIIILKYMRWWFTVKILRANIARSRFSDCFSLGLLSIHSAGQETRSWDVNHTEWIRFVL